MIADIGLRCHAYCSVQCGTVSCTTQVAHSPDGGPQALDVVETREHDRCLDETTGEAELVPRGHHTTSVLEAMVGLVRQRDLEGAVTRRDGGGVIPLQVVRCPVVQIHSLPVRVIAGVKAPTLSVELITEDELPRLPIDVVNLGPELCGGISVNETPVPRDLWYLAGGVDPAKVEAAQVGQFRLREVSDKRIAGTK